MAGHAAAGCSTAWCCRGGEPTLQTRRCRHAMREVRALGFRVGLHSAGRLSAAAAPSCCRCSTGWAWM
ncbi:MAG: hypothetical protein MZV49_11020 [Rhodopseudomonas palustris]|nr:hypothetical protein [Rhodopseudomonas palustris]